MLLAACQREDRSPFPTSVAPPAPEASVASDLGDPAIAVTGPATVQPLLERAAHADLLCLPGEGEIVDWTRRAVRAAFDREGVLAELERLAASYEPSAEVEELTLHRGTRQRVRRYASDLLAEGAGPSRCPSR